MNWKRVLAVGILCAGVFCALTLRSYALEVNAKGAVLMDADSGRVLFAQEERRELAMASTTKIMTALITLEQPGLDEWFEVDPQAIRVEGSSMGLAEGDLVTLRALAAGMLLPSGNDAANAAAVRIAGSQDAFVRRMNERAVEMGLEHTHFDTPSGLDSQTHYSTAYDMARLAREALRNDGFAALCSQYSMALEFGNPPYRRWLKNHNRLLNDYEGAAGVKTGFTGDAGRCLVSAAARGGVTLIAVTLNCPDDWRDHARMLDYGFSQVKATPLDDLVPALSLPAGGAVRDSAAVAPVRELAAALKEGEKERVRTTVQLDRFVLAPAKRGSVVGEVLMTLEGREVLRAPLCLAEDVDARPLAEPAPGFWEKLRRFFTGKSPGGAASQQKNQGPVGELE